MQKQQEGFELDLKLWGGLWILDHGHELTAESSVDQKITPPALETISPAGLQSKGVGAPLSSSKGNTLDP